MRRNGHAFHREGICRFSHENGAVAEPAGEENRETGGNILVVSHGTSILNFLRTVKPDIEIKEQIPNCSANIVTWEDGKFTVEDFGITKYIEKGREIMKESSRA